MLDSEYPRAALPALGQRPGAVVINIAGFRVKFGHAVPGAANAPDVAIADWDTMFGAVKSGLRQTVDRSRLSDPLSRDVSGQVRFDVLQCVAALDQLHTTVSHHIGRSRGLERALSDAQSALAQVRAELAGNQRGERAARRLASQDELSGLYNGAGARARLATVAAAVTQGRPFSVLHIDLDGFKAIDDAHGHAIGDQLLEIIAARLSGAVRAEDMMSRMGGDKFACLLWVGSPGRQALSRLARILFDTVSAPCQVGTLSLQVRPSIGIAVWPADGPTAERLLEHADAAMALGKRRKSGHAFFDQVIDL